jgi:hypothetical protein
VLDITEVISLLQVIYGLNAFARKYSGVITWKYLFSFQYCIPLILLPTVWEMGVVLLLLHRTIWKGHLIELMTGCMKYLANLQLCVIGLVCEWK